MAGEKLSEAQDDALLWLWPASRRQWLGAQYCTPSEVSIAALDALVRKGLATKDGWAGRAIYYEMTDAGRARREDHPNDVCYCGDYRHQHKDGSGACDLNGLGHPGGMLCLRFRLTQRHDERVEISQHKDAPNG